MGAAGKINRCVNTVIKKGWIKVHNFSSSRNSLACTCLLAPRGVEQKAAVRVRFLRRKMAEHEVLRNAIAQLRRKPSERPEHKPR